MFVVFARVVTKIIRKCNTPCAIGDMIILYIKYSAGSVLKILETRMGSIDEAHRKYPHLH